MEKGRIPSLDGLRAVSIVAVTVSHYIPRLFPTSAGRLAERLGAAGVDVFFVISGFLITSLMLREHDKYGKISLTGFYKRRCLRIFPAYFFFLLVVFLLSGLKLLPIGNHAWPYLLTYTYNLNPHLASDLIRQQWSPAVGQVWSLCVEEHFYLLWPLTLILLGARRAPLVLWASIAGAIALRFWLYPSHGGIDIDYFTPTRLDTIAVGCLLAFAFRKPWIQRVRGDRLAAGAAAAFFASLYLIRSGKYQLGPKHFIDAALIAVVIACLVQDAGGPLGRFLNWRPVVWIGVLSYSIYLAQTVVVTNLAPLALRIPAALLYACISYYLIESPFLKLKDRIGRPFHKLQSEAAAP